MHPRQFELGPCHHLAILVTATPFIARGAFVAASGLQPDAA